MSTIKRNIFYSILYQIINILLPFVTTPYLTRVLRADGIGQYAYAYSIAGYFCTFIMLGIINYGNREIAKVRDDIELCSATFWNIYTMQLVMGIILTSAYVSFCISINSSIQLIFSLYVIATTLDVSWYFSGNEEFRFLSLRNICLKILSTVCIFVFVKKSNHVIRYCSIMALSVFFSSIILWPRLIRQLGVRKPEWKEVISHIRPNITLFVSILAISIFSTMDKIMLGFFSGSSEVGYYELSERVLAIPMAIIYSVGSVMLPRTAFMVSKRKETDRLLYTTTVIVAFFVSATSFGIMGVAQEFVPFYYGEGFDKCIILYYILLPSCIMMSLSNIVRTQYLLPAGKDKVYVLSTVYGAVLNFIVNFILVVKYGSLGVSIGTIIAHSVVTVYQCYKCKNEIPILYYIKKTFILYINGFIMFVFLCSLSLDSEFIFTKLLIKIITGAIIYILLLFIEEITSKALLRRSLFDISALSLKL